MCLVLACGIGAVVAADAVAEDIHMIEVCRYPADGRVTVIAGVTTRNMCLVLACRVYAVVASDAIANNAAVIKHCG